MNFKLSTLAAAAALFACWLPDARADTLITTIHHWKVTDSRELSLCRARGDYADGNYLDFYINKVGALSIALTNPKWNIPAGKYSVVSWIDRVSPTTFHAESEDNFVMWHPVLDDNAVGLISNGRTMYIRVGSETYSYDLAWSGQMLKAVAACAAKYMDAANPFAGQPSASAPPANPFAETTSNPYRRM